MNKKSEKPKSESKKRSPDDISLLSDVVSRGSVDVWEWSLKTDEISPVGERSSVFGIPGNVSPIPYAEWERIIHPSDLIRTREALYHSLKYKTRLDIEFRVKWPDGSIHWIMSRANAYYDVDGSPMKMVGISIDTTRHRAGVEGHHESEERFHTMCDSAPFMIWTTAADKRMTFVNKAWLDFRGRSPDQETGEGWFEGIHEEDRKEFFEVFHSSLDARQEFKIDYRLRRRDGEYRWITTHSVPRFAEEEFIGFIGVNIDVTDRKDLEREKDDLVSIASHELKTPVTSIKAYAQILQEKFRKTNDELAANMLMRLELQIDKLTGLINTLLDVAKIQSGQLDYSRELFDIRALVVEVTDDMQHVCPEHRLQTVITTDGRLYGDRARLGQVLTNLISNAVKYSPAGTNVIVEVVRDGKDYVFSVEDFGMGIPEDMQDKVFARFFRVSESNRVSGLGLGLYISAQIIQQHGGKLWLKSQSGRGSKFFFSLPIRMGNEQNGEPARS